jgi:thiol-disulfide isomerase/thioredoxin
MRSPVKNLKLLTAFVLSSLLFVAPGCQGGGAGGPSTLASIGEWINVEDTSPTLESLRGKPVVVEFWATWCPPCVKSTPHLVELHEKHADSGLTILGIHASRGAGDREEIGTFLERYGIEYPIGLDVKGTAMDSYGVSGIPRAFVYDREGALVWDGHPLDPRFDQAVAGVL